jgi:hypothetical protein
MGAGVHYEDLFHEDLIAALVDDPLWSRRSWLHDALVGFAADESVDAPAWGLIEGGSGTGKSTLVAALAREQPT